MSLTERRIQVYFPAREYAALQQRARADGKSVAQVLREAAALYLKRDPADAIREGYRVLLQGAGVCRDGRGDVSEHHDRYLGEKGW